MKKHLPAIAVAAAALGLASTASAELVDAEGDAFATFGMGSPLHDIDLIDIQFTATDLVFMMSFHDVISAPSLLNGNEMIGVLELDVDQSAATGDAPLQNLFSPPFSSLGAGIDYLVDFASELNHPGFVEVYGTAIGMPAMIPVAYGPQSISGSIPLSVIGGDDGIVDFTALIGTYDQPTDATDFVGTSAPLPAPGALALLGLAGVAGSNGRRRK